MILMLLFTFIFFFVIASPSDEFSGLGGFDLIFMAVPAIMILLLIGGILVYTTRIREYYRVPPRQVPAYVHGKDFESLATDADRTAGSYRVRLVTVGGATESAELLPEDAHLVGVADVGLAGLRGSRLVDFKKLNVMRRPSSEAG